MQTTVIVKRFLIAVLIIFDILIIVIGIWNLSACRAQPGIPIFLIVIGICGFISLLILISRSWTDYPIFELSVIAEAILYVINVLFMGLGTFWVFKILPPSKYKNNPHYCDPVAYWLAFICVLVFWIVLVLICCTACYLVIITGSTDTHICPAARLQSPTGR